MRARRGRGRGCVAAREVSVREGGLRVTYWMDRESRTLVQYQS